ncbi:hypothetical protein HOC35_04245 [Candidatus Woesearchaeota archaeon]|jgi:uncharacterized protein (UPF0147 family)|nr:hypothetical protein [Candidatus Woesearchaeota archaeon]
MSDEKINNIIDVMKELLDDQVVPRNVKARIDNAMKALQEKQDISIKINKALDELEEIGDDANMEPYTRSQIWNLVSALESC